MPFDRHPLGVHLSVDDVDETLALHRRSISNCCGGIARSRMQYPSSRYCFFCSSVTTTDAAAMDMLVLLVLMRQFDANRALCRYRDGFA